MQCTEKMCLHSGHCSRAHKQLMALKRKGVKRLSLLGLHVACRTAADTVLGKSAVGAAQGGLSR